MSESTESTQPVKASPPNSSLEDTQENIKATPRPENNPAQSQLSTMVSPKEPMDPDESQASALITPKKPKKRWAGRIGRFFLNLLIFLVIIILGVFGGYRSGIGIRQRAQESLVNQQLSDQFARALVDMQFGNYEQAKSRLEYIIGVDPSYPGAMEKLTEVMVMSSIPTATPYVSPTPELIVVDDTDYNGLFAQAQQLIAAKQWQNAITVLDTLRKKDPAFNTVQVDGMYYYALRNLGVEMIQAGNLEGGLYQLVLAERFAPLDNIAHYLQDNARFYVTAASFWELDWQRAAEYFYQVSGSGLWDGTMTASERYRIAAMRYGDQLYNQGNYCDAYGQYQYSEAIGPLEDPSIGNSYSAYQECYPPTEAAPVATEVTEDNNDPPPAATEPSPAATEPPPP